MKIHYIHTQGLKIRGNLRLYSFLDWFSPIHCCLGPPCVNFFRVIHPGGGRDPSSKKNQLLIVQKVTQRVIMKQRYSGLDIKKIVHYMSRLCINIIHRHIYQLFARFSQHLRIQPIVLQSLKIFETSCCKTLDKLLVPGETKRIQFFWTHELALIQVDS